MKLLILILAVLVSVNLYAQDVRDDVETPLGSNVVAWRTEEASDATNEYWDDYFATAYPNAVQITTYFPYSSSRRFNCHSYAWHMMSIAGGFDYDDPRWIGYYPGNTDEHVYWTDGSYKEVASEIYPGKVSWASGDHSAITTSTSGVFISKWNQYPLMEHDWDDSPFGSSNLKYYKLCYEEITDDITSDLTKQACKLLIKDVTIQNNAHVEIDVEDWIKIEGPFNTTSGTTLDIQPY